jgi:esterase/lipase superfamily enzyme
VVLLGVHPEPPSKFYADLRACMERTARKEAFVFIHGYNVGFETAVRRTAQIAYDLKFDGAPIVYSWPSQEGLLSYIVDETNVAWTVPHLKDFLLSVAEQSGAKSVHLVAHSMGNRALTSALRELAMERKEKCPRFHEVVLTAPDIDADVFRRDLAPAIVGTADRVTLYASSNDEALIASRAVHGYRRAGESGDNVVVVPGVDTVDVSAVDTSLIGHSYYGSNRTVLADLFELLRGSKPADHRKWLQSMRLGALKYWKFLPGQAAPSPPPGQEL